MNDKNKRTSTPVDIEASYRSGEEAGRAFARRWMPVIAAVVAVVVAWALGLIEF